MPIQPKSVLFDYGNVLCQPQNRAETEAMAAILDTPVADFEKAYWKWRAAFDEAAITPETYWLGVGDGLSRTLSDLDRERLTDLDNRSWAHPDPTMVNWATALRNAGLKTAILSNMPITLRAHLPRFCDWLPEFDHSCYSCDVRLAKPAREIFLSCLEGLGAAPEEALFLDDREENIAAARALGIHAIHYSSPEQAQCEINQRYNLPVPILLQTDCGGLAARSQSSF